MSLPTEWLIPMSGGPFGAISYGIWRQRRAKQTGFLRYGMMLRVDGGPWFGGWVSIGPEMLRWTSRGLAKRRAPAEVALHQFALVGERKPVGRERAKFMPGSSILHLSDGSMTIEVVVGPVRGLREQVIAGLGSHGAIPTG